MIQLNNYIIEKLRINADIKVSNPNEKLIPSEEDFKRIRWERVVNGRTQSGNGHYSSIGERDDAIRLRNVNRLIHLYIALLIITGSEPFIKDNKIYSYPGNYGHYYIEQILKYKNDIDFNEIIDTYDEALDKYKEKCNWKEYTGIFEHNIEAILNSVSKTVDYEIKPFTEKSYSDAAKKFIDLKKNTSVVPFTAKCGKYSAECELVFDSHANNPHYYGFIINGKDYKTSQDFIKELKKEFNLEW